MLVSLNQRIRRPISLWLDINSLSTVHSKDKGPQTKGNMDKVPKRILTSQSKFKRFQINIESPYFYESFCY